jgi:GTPase
MFLHFIPSSCHAQSYTCLTSTCLLSRLRQSLASILKKPGVRKKPYLVRGHDEVLTAARNITSDSLAPIFLTSAVTGARQATVHVCLKVQLEVDQGQ